MSKVSYYVYYILAIGWGVLFLRDASEIILHEGTTAELNAVFNLYFYKTLIWYLLGEITRLRYQLKVN